MKLPTLLKTTPPFEGFPIPLDTSLPLIDFYIGEDVILQAPLMINDEFVTPEKWTVTAHLKNCSQGTELLWLGVMENGIYYKNERPGFYTIIVPKCESRNLKPGTHWIDIVAEELLGAGEFTVDRKIVVARIPFGMNYSASSRITEEVTPKSFDITKV